MGTIAEDMARLRNEMKSLRDGREAFVRDLRAAVPKILAGYRKVHAQTAQQAAAERRAFVSRMLAGYRKSHAQMAEQTAAERRAFVSEMRKKSAEMQRELARDLAGFRQAWYGPVRAEGEPERWSEVPRPVEMERPRGGRKRREQAE